MCFHTSGITEAEVWTEDSEGYSDFQIVTEIWVEPQCGFVQMPVQSTAMYLHPLQYHQLPDAVSTTIVECSWERMLTFNLSLFFFNTSSFFCTI